LAATDGDSFQSAICHVGEPSLDHLVREVLQAIAPLLMDDVIDEQLDVEASATDGVRAPAEHPKVIPERETRGL
jgi:hypothetical protein